MAVTKYKITVEVEHVERYEPPTNIETIQYSAGSQGDLYSGKRPVADQMLMDFMGLLDKLYSDLESTKSFPIEGLPQTFCDELESLNEKHGLSLEC